MAPGFSASPEGFGLGPEGLSMQVGHHGRKDGAVPGAGGGAM